MSERLAIAIAIAIAIVECPNLSEVLITTPCAAPTPASSKSTVPAAPLEESGHAMAPSRPRLPNRDDPATAHIPARPLCAYD